MSSFGGDSSINLAKQKLLVRRDWPTFSAVIKGNVLIARGTLKPTQITAEYSVRIEYQLGSPPKAFVEDPKLTRRAGAADTPIPHTYDGTSPGKERPCVFYPREDWSPTKAVSKTVIPWLMAWLVDYELWHATGEWMGGGRHPEVERGGKLIPRVKRRAARAARR